MRAFLLGFWTGFRRSLLLLVIVILLGSSSLLIVDQADRTRLLTRRVEFDFLGWTLGAWIEKAATSNLSAAEYLDSTYDQQLVLDYLAELDELQGARDDLELAYGDPGLEDRDRRLKELSTRVAALNSEAGAMRPMAEAILEGEAEQILRDYGFGFEGAIIPPLSFTFAPLPSALIVSPRNVIRQDLNINLRLDLDLVAKIKLEQAVETATGSSALVVPVGGLGTYPTMVQESTALVWVTEVIGHEWVHNYLALRPLGLRYGASPDLRTMNETTAALMGVAIGHEILRQFYPDLLPSAPAPSAPSGETPAEPVFDFRAEMRQTRVTVDQLLEQGEIDQAEAYMEARRTFFWDHGYHIRRLNQAYFAFHGAYADEPGGAAGDDPVGEAVRKLWERADSPYAFLQQMARMRQIEDLWEAAGRLTTTR